MDSNTLIIMLIIGAAAGWLAGFVRQGQGFGLLGNIVIGIIGSFVGDWLFRQLGIQVSSGLLGAILRATVGAVVLLFVLGLVQGGSRQTRRR
ncbi:MAG: GlsB/YeaQ/YmgE family stress response membrane protein [Saprospiraceae bacterium]